MSRVDDAVKRILRVKFVMGLFENPLADYSMAKYLGSQVLSLHLVPSTKLDTLVDMHSVQSPLVVVSSL
ncbi:hypothetical protein L6452_14594 [Arctium lappa]|uniref:Uncharacterized protein n=1 Tax=Arctium lappa TaxID=4217 RepID=A0ACB9CLH9_ARCLA|nr:hypothetical protein L6452_14594 [Arctium lappa]